MKNDLRQETIAIVKALSRDHHCRDHLCSGPGYWGDGILLLLILIAIPFLIGLVAVVYVRTMS